MHRDCAWAWAFVLLAFAGAGRAAADIVVMVDGRRIEGEVVDKGAELEVRTRTGRITLSKSEVASIEKKETPEKELARNLAALKPEDAKGRYELAQWAKERGLASSVGEILKKVVEIDPNHEEARKELGFIKYDGKWLTEPEFYAAKGYVRFEGRWVKKSEQAAILMVRKTTGLIDELLKLGDTGEATLKDLKALGDEPLKEAISRLKEADAAAVKALSRIGGQEDLEKKIEDLRAKREAALKVIFDLKVYPDADHGRIGQPAVDEKVNAVKSAWPEAKEAFEKFRAAQAPRLQACSRVKTIRGLIASAEGLLKGAAAAPPNAADLENALPKAIGAESAHWAEAMKVFEHNRTAKSTIADKERENADAVNEYRFMMGLRPFEISEKLVQAARKHSEEMRDKNYFGHVSPTPELKTFVDRCKKEGCTKPMGENCHVGSNSGVGAFNGWYHSSGHHRNMLGKATQIGVGYASGGGSKTMPGNYWTQNFGGEQDVK